MESRPELEQLEAMRKTRNRIKVRALPSASYCSFHKSITDQECTRQLYIFVFMVTANKDTNLWIYSVCFN